MYPKNVITFNLDKITYTPTAAEKRALANMTYNALKNEKLTAESARKIIDDIYNDWKDKVVEGRNK